MNYAPMAIIVFALLTLVSLGWYFLFKRFERRMNARMDDLVARSDETLKSFADTYEIMAARSRDLHEHIEIVVTNQGKAAEKRELADRKMDLSQGIQLVIKQDLFLDHARTLGKEYHERGEISAQDLAKLEVLIDEMKLDNYSRY